MVLVYQGGDCGSRRGRSRTRIFNRHPVISRIARIELRKLRRHAKRERYGARRSRWRSLRQLRVPSLPWDWRSPDAAAWRRHRRKKAPQQAPLRERRRVSGASRSRPSREPRLPQARPHACATLSEVPDTCSTSIRKAGSRAPHQYAHSKSIRGICGRGRRHTRESWKRGGR